MSFFRKSLIEYEARGEISTKLEILDDDRQQDIMVLSIIQYRLKVCAYLKRQRDRIEDPLNNISEIRKQIYDIWVLESSATIETIYIGYQVYC